MRRNAAVILRGNALTLPLADATVDLIVTSPPYFGLRSYQDGGEHYDGQIGSEATPAEFVDALLEATREMVRVLKPSGSLFVNLGDKYSGGMRSYYDADAKNAGRNGRRTATPKIPEKSLIGIPWRYAIACIDQLGLILRAEVIWSKPNGLPESVTDRVRRSHEQWFHFTVSPRYFSAVDEIREEHLAPPKRPGLNPRIAAGLARGDDPSGWAAWTTDAESTQNPLGKLPGSVWIIPTQPLTVPPHLGVDHFAAFPMEWPRRIIQGWSPSGVCTGCGQGRRPVVDIQSEKLTGSHGTARGFIDGHEPNGNKRGINADNAPRLRQSATIIDYACACTHTTAPTTPAVILDPFGGTGTVALVAKALGRHGISLDMSADYCRLAAWRTSDEGEMARALQVDKPAKQTEGQLSLLEGLW